MSNKTVTIIAAITDTSYGIGLNGDLPWRPGSLIEDMKKFKEVTIGSPLNSKQNAVIMGRKTWESIPKKFRPLENRINIVVSSNDEFLETLSTDDKSCLGFKSFSNALETSFNSETIGDVFIIGGQMIYDQAIKHKLVDKLLITFVNDTNEQKINCDTFFPKFDTENEWRNTKSSDLFTSQKLGTTYQIREFNRVKNNKEEIQYLDLVEKIIKYGDYRLDRTGVGTYALFGERMKFSLKNNIFPLLTSKKVFWRGVVEELLWFIKGDTNGKHLSEKDIHIWDGHGSREYLDSIGLNEREEGDLGPVYGFQWRHYGAKYVDCNTDYTGQGIDQLKECIDLIKNDPTSRRIILSSWNPIQKHEMALPPCHMFCQFFVSSNGTELSCQMYQRSADMGLGVPFNIASYALLTRILAQVCNLKANELICVLGDAHVYSNHVEALKEQIISNSKNNNNNGCCCYPFPELNINPEKSDIDSFLFDDFKLINYQYLKQQNKMKMAI